MRDGVVSVMGTQLPSFLYDDPANYDPDDIDKGLCKGPLLISVSVSGCKLSKLIHSRFGNTFF
jgi:hypothetical protein